MLRLQCARTFKDHTVDARAASQLFYAAHCGHQCSGQNKDSEMSDSGTALALEMVLLLSSVRDS